jgi:hypothetical protein
LTFAQRSKLHKVIADWYESGRSPRAASEISPLLAYHLSEVIDDKKEAADPDLVVNAIRHLRKAGETAAKNGETDAACAWLDHAMTMANRLPDCTNTRKLQRELQLQIMGIGLCNLPPGTWMKMLQDDIVKKEVSLRVLSGVAGTKSK